MTTFLTDSADLVPVPPVDPDRAATVNPDLYSGWAEMFARNQGRLDYLLEPRDFRDWGPLVLRNMPGHSADRPATIRYFDPDANDDVHPVRRSEAARIDSFQFAGALTTDWLVHGLTVSPPSVHPSVNQGATNITIDY